MNLYEKLGVSNSSSKKEIQSAYRKLSKKYHPDMQHGKSDDEKKAAEEKFKEISEAANILLDDDKRKRYDQYGSVDENMQSGFDPFEMFREHFHGMGGFGEMFGFGGMGRQRDPNAPINGDDLQTIITVTFKESVNGCTKELRLPNEHECEKCHGTGNADGKNHNCPVCRGTGIETSVRGNCISQFTCRSCHGRGQTQSTPCSECGGRGIIVKETMKTVQIPKGVDTRSVICLDGCGKSGKNGGRNGNLILIVQVEKSEIFERHGLDVYTFARITPIDLLLGNSVEVADPYCEKVEVRIPDGFDTSKTLRVRNHGIRGDNGFRGDLYVRLFVVRPDSIGDDCVKSIGGIDGELKGLRYSAIDEMKNKMKAYVEE